MNNLQKRLGFWSSVIIAILVVLIDAGMILSAILYPMATITSIEAYASSFNNWQMLPLVPSLLFAPMFIVMMLSIHHYASDDKKIFSQLGLSFALISATVLSIHYYIQLTVVRFGILSNQIVGLWQFTAPNPHSFFWAFAALGYGFMGLSLLCVAPVFIGRSEHAIKLLFIANGVIGIGFIIGNALDVFIVNILASFVWGLLFPISAILMAKVFRTLDAH